MDSATLTFTALNERIDALPDHQSLAIAPTKRQRWGYAIGFGAGFIGLIGISSATELMATVIFSHASL